MSFPPYANIIDCMNVWSIIERAKAYKHEQIKEKKDIKDNEKKKEEEDKEKEQSERRA